MATGTEIEVYSSNDRSALELFKDIITGKTDVQIEVVEDPAEIQAEISQQIVSAESLTDLFAIGNATGWHELENVPVELRSFRWRHSSFEEGGPLYVVVSAVAVDTGEVLVLTTGSNTVLAQLYGLAKLEQIPGVQVKLTKAAKATQAGFYPLQLELVAPAPSEDES